MSNHIPSYLFHIPKNLFDTQRYGGKVLTPDKLERLVQKNQAPEVVDVIENKHRGRKLGAVPPTIALLKYR